MFDQLFNYQILIGLVVRSNVLFFSRFWCSFSLLINCKKSNVACERVGFNIFWCLTCSLRWIKFTQLVVIFYRLKNRIWPSSDRVTNGSTFLMEKITKARNKNNGWKMGVQMLFVTFRTYYKKFACSLGFWERIFMTVLFHRINTCTCVEWHNSEIIVSRF